MTPQTADAGNEVRSAQHGWSSDPDSPAATPATGPVIPGHVSIAPKVLQKVGSAVVAEDLRVERRDVRVDARDDEGRLALRVATPMTIPALTSDVAAPHGGVVGTVRALQESVSRRIGEITGRAVSRVDVTITGSRLESKGSLR